MEPYFLFLFCGILPWTWFQASIAEGSGSLIARGKLHQEGPLPARDPAGRDRLHQFRPIPPRPAHPPALPGLHGKLSATALLLPLPILVQLVFTLGLALLVSALTVHFRDLQSILAHVLHLWFFATPIIYPYVDQAGRLPSAEPPYPRDRRVPTDALRRPLHHWRGLPLAALATYPFGAGLRSSIDCGTRSRRKSDEADDPPSTRATSPRSTEVSSTGTSSRR